MNTKPKKFSLARVGLFLRAVRMVWQSQPGLSAGVAILAILSAFMAPLQIWITKMMIDRITLLVSGGSAVGMESLFLPLGLFIAVWGIGQVLNSATFSLRNLLSERADWYVQQQIMKKAAALDLAFFETPGFYDQMTLCKEQTWRLGAITMQFPEILSQLMTLASVLALLASLNPLFPVVLLVFSLPKVAAQGHFTRQKAELYLRHVPAERMLQYMAELLSERQWVKEVRLFGLQDHLLKRHAHASQEYVNSLIKVSASQEKGNLLLTLLSLIGTVGIWGYTLAEAVAQRITLGDVALVFQAVERGRAALDQAVFFGAYFLEHGFYLEAIFAFLDLQPEAVAGALVRRTNPQHAGNFSLDGPVEFQHVSFRYPGVEHTCLNDVSFTLLPGEKVALVGENGAGKTTLVKLLARLYDPCEGEIRANGTDLREIDPPTWYRSTSVIFQDFYRYDLTVRENIAFGDVEAGDDLSFIHRAAELGGAAGMIEKLPQKYATMLGKRFDGGDGAGVDLSGGEWQKLALARAFLRTLDKKDAKADHKNLAGKLLILDEPTAALDAYAESEVYNRFAELTRGQTTLFVTHRLSSVQMADKILVLKEGRLIEEGSHASLMAQGGEYARMFNLQAQRYRDEAESPASHMEGAMQ